MSLWRMDDQVRTGIMESCVVELDRERKGRTQNSSVTTDVAWTLSLSKREGDEVSKLSS